MSSKLSRRNEPTFIASSSSRPYLAADMFRFLASLLVAFGLMFAPVAMAHGQIMAAPHNSASAMVKIDDGVGKHSPSSSHRSEMDLICAKIGRASCRERVCKYVWISGWAVSFKK